jgi:hypothetical protein
VDGSSPQADRKTTDAATAPDVRIPPLDGGGDAPAADGPVPMGTGLRGEYFDGVALEAGDTGVLQLSRLDATIDFGWGYGRPDPRVTYTFSASTDDGVRLWVDGKLLVDNWVDQEVTTRSGSVELIAYRKYNIRLEYYDAIEDAIVTLSWSSRSQRSEIVPSVCLFAP